MLSTAGQASAREQAIEELLRVEADRTFVGLGTGKVLGGDERTRRQVREYVAGVTRWRRWLDFLIAHFYRGNATKLEPRLRQILRLGLYELLYQETPPHAALNEAVELAKRYVRPKAGGLVNGILRTTQRQQTMLPEPSRGSWAERLAVRHSHPTWMVKRWLNTFGEAETRKLLVWNNRRPTYDVRPNPLKLTGAEFRALLKEADVTYRAARFNDTGVTVPSVQPLLKHGWLQRGLCSVQDEAAGLVVQLLDPQPHETVLDTCAAPGGKAFYAAERMENTGTLHVWDVHAGRLSLVMKAAEERGYTEVRERVVDVAALPPDVDHLRVDRVLVDVPCTGTGVLAKRADLRWNRTEQDLAELCTLQQRLLEQAATLVRPSGVLVYSTCSIEPEENEMQVQAFLQNHPDFMLESVQRWIPGDVATPHGHYVSLPHVHGMDGAFAARLRRRG